MCRRVVKVHIRVSFEPPVTLGFVRRKIVQDYMQFRAGSVLRDHTVHEVEKLTTAASPIVTRKDLPGVELQGGEEGCGPIALVFVCRAGESFAIWQPQPALGALQRLDAGLLIHAQHDGPFGRA